MGYQRYQRFEVAFSQRASVPVSEQSAVDSILKSLKSTSRELNRLCSVYRHEAQLLDRLYYKGKNQHRCSIFWRRVVEMRRYFMRLGDVGIDEIVGQLYSSFFGETAWCPRLMKSSWSHCPEVFFVSSVQERLHACIALIEKTKSCLLSAYTIFVTAMEMGAFVQLLLTLVSICSRMDILMSDILDTLNVCRLLCGDVSNVPRSSRANEVEDAALPRSVLCLVDQVNVKQIGHLNEERSCLPQQHTSAQEIIMIQPFTASKRIEKTSSDDSSTVASISVIKTKESNAKMASSNGVPIIIQTSRRRLQGSSTHPRPYDTATQPQKRDLTKKKWKKDEIDNMFNS